MHYRGMGSYGLHISAISLGGWTTFGSSVKDSGVIRAILTRAHDGGVNFFDAADVYAHGEAEREMGRVLKDYPRHTLVLSSKVFFPVSDDPNDRGLSRKHVHESVRRSLQRLGTDYLDLYFAHRFDPEVRMEEVVRAFSDLVDQGLVLYWGTSEWPAAAIREAVALARQGGWHPPAVEQPEYSLLHRRRVEAEIVPVTEEAGMGIVVWSPLAQGLLTGKHDRGIASGTRFERLPQFTQGYLAGDNLARVRTLADVARDAGLTRAQLALAWVLARPAITCAIVGATRVEQLEENLAAADARLSDEILQRLDSLFAPDRER